jgi:hypothetical protein
VVLQYTLALGDGKRLGLFQQFLNIVAFFIFESLKVFAHLLVFVIISEAYLDIAKIPMQYFRLKKVENEEHIVDI